MTNNKPKSTARNPAAKKRAPKKSAVPEKIKRSDARVGNQFWKARTKHGRNRKFTALTLWRGCVEYFEWVDANPLLSEKAFHTDGHVTFVEIPKMRAMTIGGLCIFLDIDQSTWGEYRGLKDFSLVTTRAEEIIRTQKFTGAAADMLNPNIIARELGLAEKRDHSSADGSMSPIAEKPMTDDLAKELLKELRK